MLQYKLEKWINIFLILFWLLLVAATQDVIIMFLFLCFMNNMHFGISKLEIWRIKQLFLCFFLTFKDLTKVRVFINLVKKIVDNTENYASCSLRAITKEGYSFSLHLFIFFIYIFNVLTQDFNAQRVLLWF